MDMNEKQSKSIWVFADTPGLPFNAVFIDCKNEIAKSGSVEFPVINLEATSGNVKLSKWKTEVIDCVNKWGSNSENWKGKDVIVNLNNKGKLSLKPAQVE